MPPSLLYVVFSKPLKIEFNPLDVKKILGIDSFSKSDLISHLESLGCHVDENLDILSVTVPSWRNDLKQSIDLVEEIALLVGLDSIASLPPFNLENNLA